MEQRSQKTRIFKKFTLKHLMCFATILLILYVMSYLILSSFRGYYHPSIYGGNEGGIKSYRWFPLGDHETSEIGGLTLASFFFLPLTKLDCTYWHTEDKMWTKEYPIKRYYDSKSLSYRSHTP